MKVKNIFILIFLFIQNIHLSCSQGCLKCTSEDICQICDAQQNYILTEDGNCIEQVLANCLISFEKGKCSVCYREFYLDSADHLCQPISVNIKHCIVYNSSTTCQQCQPQYYIKDGICDEVDTYINDCAVYDSAFTCKRCFNYRLSLDKTSCIDDNLQMDLNCAYRYFPLECDICKQGYYFLDQISNELEAYKELVLLNTVEYKSKISYKNFSKCQQQQNQEQLSQDCQQKGFIQEQCLSCENGYYYETKSKTCKKNPEPNIVQKLLINNCYYINNKNECEKCFEDYFIHYSKKKCIKHTQRVKGCSIMSQKIDSNCIKCDNDLYLQNSFECLPRIFKDQNCEIYSFFQDKCLQCKDNFILINSQEKCMQKIDQCLTHDIGYNEIQCSECIENYYLNGQGKCIILEEDKKRDNCIKYDNSQKCQECSNDHILIELQPENDFICSLINSNALFSVCKSVIKENDNYFCSSCKDNALLMSFDNECTPIQNYPSNCVDAELNNDQWICKQCIAGYYLNTGSNICVESVQRCLLYADHENLLTNESPRCLICEEGYFLVNNLCIDETLNNGDNCHLKDVDQNCILCFEEFLYSYDISNMQDEKCVLRDKYKDDYPNCEVIDTQTSDNINLQEQCVRCRQGFYLDENNQCQNCISGYCTIKDSTTQSDIKIQYDDSGTNNCQIQIDNDCLMHKTGSSYYIGNNLLSKYSVILHNNSYRDNIKQYITQGFKNNFSKYIKYLFFDNQINVDSNNANHVTCKDGFSRTFELTQITPSSHDCLTTIKNCNIRSKLFINSEKRIYSSCRQCLFSQVVYYTISQINKSLVSNIDNYLSISHQGNYLPSTFCYPNNNTTEDIHQYTQDCALYELTEQGNVAVRTCIECKPKYKKNILQDGTVQCTKINNCIYSKKTSHCERCADDWVLNEHGDCVQKSNTNIKLDKCDECYPGFSYDSLARTCNSYYDYNCKKYDKDKCIQCKNPLEIVQRYKHKMKFSEVTCTAKNNQVKPQPSNCQLVDWKGYCVKCQENYFVNLSGKCISKLEFPNCLIYNGASDDCYQCSNGYEYNPYKKVCQSKYNFQKNQICNEGFSYPFYINQGKGTACGSRTIDNCDQIDETKFGTNKLSCHKCKNGYEKSNPSYTREFCLNFKSLQNCAVHQTNLNFEYTCQKCISGYYIDHQGICQQHFTIPKCIEYEINAPYCKQCEQDYYLQDNICEKRSKFFDNCQKYFIDKDDCQNYEIKYQYLYETYDLIENPPSFQPSEFLNVQTQDYLGIPGCEIYYDYTTCKQCSSQTYLKNNTCLPVKDIIENCKVYNENQNCIQCQDQQILLQNTCVIDKNLNCLVQESEDKCTTCTKQFPFLNENKVCQKSPKIQNCQKYKSLSACEECNSGYYLNDFQCSEVDNKIDNWLYLMLRRLLFIQQEM